MRGGKLDRRITIQRKTVTISDAGGQTETWETVGVLRRSAGIGAVRGEERFAAPERESLDQQAFLIRYSSDVAEISPLWRIIYPALNAADEEPAAMQLYDIDWVTEVGRREGVRVVASRRPDATP